MTLRTKFTAALALARLCLQINNRVVQLSLPTNPFLAKAGQAVQKANKLVDRLAKDVQPTELQQELGVVLGELLTPLLGHTCPHTPGLLSWQISWMDAKHDQLMAKIKEAMAILRAITELPAELPVRNRPEIKKASPPPPSQAVTVAAEA